MRSGIHGRLLLNCAQVPVSPFLQWFLIVHRPTGGTVNYFLRIFTKCLVINVMQPMCTSLNSITFSEQRKAVSFWWHFIFILNEWGHEQTWNTYNLFFHSKGLLLKKGSFLCVIVSFLALIWVHCLLTEHGKNNKNVWTVLNLSHFSVARTMKTISSDLVFTHFYFTPKFKQLLFITGKHAVIFLICIHIVLHLVRHFNCCKDDVFPLWLPGWNHCWGQ